ncbi:MAG: indolepyruvate oxidoreductase subunit beta [Candidatus Omnitrophica bacterium]|nr:indolepyruvate oxidoreductase subunit beta [Candidatus Omnitrophota bacterium]
MKKTVDIVICGVGGQGIILVSDLLGEACVKAGLPVTGSETHGMAQRGGSVEAHIRMGGVFGPKVPLQQADLLLALEPLEAARFSLYLRAEGLAIVNLAPIKPITQKTTYPQQSELLALVKKTGANMIADDFTCYARKIGSEKILNVLMVGVASPFLPVGFDCLREALKTVVREKFWKINEQALQWGRDYCQRIFSPQGEQGRDHA